MTALTAAWNDVAGELSAIPPVLERMRYASVIRPLLELPRSANILEAGCGAGRVLRTLDALGFKNLTGLEISTARLNFVRRAGPAARLICTDGVPFADSAFDAVVSAAVIEHIAQPDRWLADLARATRRGGIVSIATDTLMWNWLKMLGLYKSVQPIDRAIWPGKLARWGSQAGLKLIACGGFVNVDEQRWYFAQQMKRLMSWRRWWFKLTGQRTGKPRPPTVYPQGNEVAAIVQATRDFPSGRTRRWMQCVWAYECFYWFVKT